MSDTTGDAPADPADDLPPSLAIAWGLRDRPRKGPKPGLSLERIVDAAVAIAVAESLDAVSMSRVAAELGASTMSLYRYVAAKDELIALMMDTAFAVEPPKATADLDWRTGLYKWAWSHLEVLRANTWLLRVTVHRPPAGPNQITWLERGLEFLGSTALPEHEKLSVVMLLIGFVRNWATTALDVPAAGSAEAAEGTEQEMISSYGKTLAALIDPEHFPALSAVIAAGVLDAPGDQDEEFVFGLDRLLDGIDVLIRDRRSRAESRQAARGGAPESGRGVEDAVSDPGR